MQRARAEEDADWAAALRVRGEGLEDGEAEFAGAEDEDGGLGGGGHAGWKARRGWRVERDAPVAIPYLPYLSCLGI